MLAVIPVIPVALSLGAINSLIPLLIIMILIAAAAGLTRGFDIFQLFGIGFLAGVAGTAAGQKGMLRKRIVKASLTPLKNRLGKGPLPGVKSPLRAGLGTLVGKNKGGKPANLLGTLAADRTSGRKMVKLATKTGAKLWKGGVGGAEYQKKMSTILSKAIGNVAASRGAGFQDLNFSGVAGALGLGAGAAAAFTGTGAGNARRKDANLVLAELNKRLEEESKKNKAAIGEMKGLRERFDEGAPRTSKLAKTAVAVAATGPIGWILAPIAWNKVQNEKAEKAMGPHIKDFLDEKKETELSSYMKNAGKPYDDLIAELTEHANDNRKAGEAELDEKTVRRAVQMTLTREANEEKVAAREKNYSIAGKKVKDKK